MNLSEGTRRLALLLGGPGAIAGGVLSYVYLQPILHQRELHKAFEQLSNSDVVKEQRKTLQTMPRTIHAQGRTIVVPYDATEDEINHILNSQQPKHKSVPAQDPWDEAAKDDDWKIWQQPQAGQPSPAQNQVLPPPPGFTLDPKTGERIEGLPPGAITTPLPSEVNKGGIATINWSHDYGVASIETTEGETLSPTPAPAGWQYLLGALLPVLGFLIPWGAIRAIGWVVTGFVQPSK